MARVMRVLARTKISKLSVSVRPISRHYSTQMARNEKVIIWIDEINHAANEVYSTGMRRTCQPLYANQSTAFIG